MNRYCKDCSKLLKGRIDKKFCNDSCRSNYNNQLNRNEDEALKMVNKILRKNKNILKHFYEGTQLELTNDMLTALDFNFKFATHQENDNEGKTYTYCYEYGYYSAEEQIKLKKAEQ